MRSNPVFGLEGFLPSLTHTSAENPAEANHEYRTPFQEPIAKAIFSNETRTSGTCERDEARRTSCKEPNHSRERNEKINSRKKKISDRLGDEETKSRLRSIFIS
jgi:hypothetical protein